MVEAAAKAGGPPLSGTYLIGKFQGVSEGQYPKLQIETTRVGADGQAVSRQQQLDFRAFDPHTGSPTQLGKSLQSLQVGDRVAVGLWQEVMEFTYKSGPNAGRPGSMVKSEATSLDLLGA